MINYGDDNNLTEEVLMEFSTFALVIFGFLAMVCIVCTIVLYPQLKSFVEALKKDACELS